jgi:hypothetical protein
LKTIQKQDKNIKGNNGEININQEQKSIIHGFGERNARIPRIFQESFQQMINDLISEVNTLGGP